MSIFNFFKKSNRDDYHPREDPKYTVPITTENLKNIFSDCSDFEMRTLSVGGWSSVPVTVCWLDGLVSSSDISAYIIRPLTDPMRFGGVTSARECLEMAVNGNVYNSVVKKHTGADEVVQGITHGFCALVFDSLKTAVIYEVRTSNQRSISEATIEKSIKGAKDAFIETLRVNTSLVRRKLRLPELKVRQTTVGRKSRTEVAILWIDGVANPDIVSDLTERLNRLDIDGMLDAGSLEEYIVDTPRSPFPQLLHTERSDKFGMNLLEGRVGLFIDGIPYGFILPATLSEFMKVAEDKGQHFIVASALTIMRWLAFLVSLTLPALWVAVAMYHQEMIPTKLLLSIISAKQNVPLGVSMEVVTMLISFELLQEAGLRLPAPVGQTVSIIGALIVGQSAIEARIVSPIPVIVVAFAGIAGYTMPSQDLSSTLRISRFFLVIAAMAGGLFGLMAGISLLTWHLCSLESFGVAYTHPFTDAERKGLRHVLLRQPMWSQKLRNPSLHTPDKRKQK